MIAPVGIQVSDMERSQKFYMTALAPIGYQRLREYGVTPTRPAASAGFGQTPRANLWIYQGEANAATTHIAFLVNKRSIVDAFYRAAIGAAAKTTVHQVLGHNTAPTITAPL